MLHYEVRTDHDRERDNAWVATRRDRAKQYLGGACVDCGKKTGLQFDHIKANTKGFEIGANLNRRWAVLRPELDKCVLRCPPCHRRKTSAMGEAGGGQNKWKTIHHGTCWAYIGYGCRCDECRAAQSKYKRKYRRIKEKKVIRVRPL